MSDQEKPPVQGSQPEYATQLCQKMQRGLVIVGNGPLCTRLLAAAAVPCGACRATGRPSADY